MSAIRNAANSENGSRRLVARLCHLRAWTDFTGYGFNICAIKGKRGHYVQNVERGSPAQAGGLRFGDRVVEVNGINICSENHQQVNAVSALQLALTSCL